MLVIIPLEKNSGIQQTSTICEKARCQMPLYPCNALPKFDEPSSNWKKQDPEDPSNACTLLYRHPSLCLGY
jgi:hypothetical protein